MKDLNYQLNQLSRRNRDGSYRTQADRASQLNLIANQLFDLGYRGMNVRSLKPKHVEALVEHWKDSRISIGAIKNRLSVLRWWAQKTDRRNVVARSNDHYGIPDRKYVTNVSKAKSILKADLEKIKDPHVRLSLELQQVFGLRREEAIKFRSSYADKGDHIALKASWTKGGKSRVIPVRSNEQRAVLDKVKHLAGTGSLIPAERKYIQQLRIYERQTVNAGLSRMHGLRHAYAQQRYLELTGRFAPAAGGRQGKLLQSEQKLLDQNARQIISRELGHDRVQIVSIYLGV